MLLQEAILQKLKEKDLTQAWLARQVGITTTEMCHITKGRIFPRYNLLVKIMDKLDIQMDFTFK